MSAADWWRVGYGADFARNIERIAGSLEKIAGGLPAEGASVGSRPRGFSRTFVLSKEEQSVVYELVQEHIEAMGEVELMPAFVEFARRLGVRLEMDSEP